MTDIMQQRAMLQILIAACSTARSAFEAAANEIDEQLVADLRKVIERSEGELEKLNARIEAGEAS